MTARTLTASRTLLGTTLPFAIPIGLSAFLLFMGVHTMESYVLTPILQRQALDIPPATLFAFQILLGVVFGIWGLALALPLVAIAKVMIDHFKTYEAPPLAEAA